ncbi:MAG: hypothetical protein GY928_20585 [Colwellia sp.]|nr:hypothetical protein [Colwellia sp.]
MSNTIKIIDMVAKEMVRHLDNEAIFARGVSKGYDSKFGVKGAKIGDTIRIQMPNRFYAADGANFVNQDYTEGEVSLAITSRKHVGFNFSTKEATLDFDNLSENTIKPAAIALSNKLDLDGLTTAAQAAYSSVGTPGVRPGTANGSGTANSASVDLMTNAGMFLDHFSAPQGTDRYMVVNPTGMAGVSKGLSGMYNDRAKISEIYKDGRMRGTHLGFNIGMDQNVKTITTGTRDAANTTVLGANQTGANLNVAAMGNATTAVIGDRFTIAGVQSVNPVNQEATGELQQFVVTANATSAANGEATLGISPSIVVAAANVANGTVNALAANDAVMTWNGAVSTAGVNNLAYHKSAIVLGTADLEMPDDNVVASRVNHNGISLRVVKFYDGANDLNKVRVDVLYGWKIVRPEHLCVVYG